MSNSIKFKIFAHGTRSAFEPNDDNRPEGDGPTGSQGPTGPTGATPNFVLNDILPPDNCPPFEYGVGLITGPTGASGAVLGFYQQVMDGTLTRVAAFPPQDTGFYWMPAFTGPTGVNIPATGVPGCSGCFTGTVSGIGPILRDVFVGDRAQWVLANNNLYLYFAIRPTRWFPTIDRHNIGSDMMRIQLPACMRAVQNNAGGGGGLSFDMRYRGYGTFEVQSPPACFTASPDDIPVVTCFTVGNVFFSLDVKIIILSAGSVLQLDFHNYTNTAIAVSDPVTLFPIGDPVPPVSLPSGTTLPVGTYQTSRFEFMIQLPVERI